MMRRVSLHISTVVALESSMWVQHRFFFFKFNDITFSTFNFLQLDFLVEWLIGGVDLEYRISLSNICVRSYFCPLLLRVCCVFTLVYNV